MSRSRLVHAALIGFVLLGSCSLTEGGSPSLLLVGGQPIAPADQERLDRALVGPLYALADVNGDELLDAQDLDEALRASQGAGDVLCTRAADVNFDNRLDQLDMDFIGRVQGFNELRLFASAHLSCRAFARVAGRNVGAPGERVPLLLLADLRTGVAATVVLVESGPGTLVTLDSTGQSFGVDLSPAAQDGARVLVLVHTEYSAGVPGVGRTYSIPIDVREP